MTIKNIFLAFVLFLKFDSLQAQQGSPAQDPSLNNLVLPENYKTGMPGELGAITKSGSGKQSMILIPGLGFGGDVFSDFIKAYEKNFTIYSITPAGFGGTPAPPMPDSGVAYSRLTWTDGITQGILKLIEKEKLAKPVVVAHFVTATQVALNLAINHSGKIGKVIIIGGSPYRYYASQKDGQWNDWEHEMKFTPEKREKLIEAYWAPQWFKTVTKETWDANMWMPADYCKDGIIGEKLFDESAAVPVPVMIRYLLEYMAYDASPHYAEINVPVLVMMPDFDGWLYTKVAPDETTVINPALLYLKYFHQVAWQRAIDSQNHFLKFETVPGTRLFMWYDNPVEVYRHINAFLADKN